MSYPKKFTDFLEKYYFDRGVAKDVDSRLRHHSSISVLCLCADFTITNAQKLAICEGDLLRAEFPEDF